MLKKLLKHEWNAVARKYGLFYLVLGVLTLVTCLIRLIPVENLFFNLGKMALLVLYILALIGVFFCSTAMGVVRFYKNMVTEEGYLTFTLPVKVEQLVISKLLVAFAWQMITIVLCLLSVFLVFVPGHISFGEFFGELSVMFDSLGGTVALIGVMMVVSIVYQFLFYYLSIAIGQLFNDHKIVGAVVAYCALNFVIEMVIMILMFAVFGLAGVIDMSESMNTLDGINTMYLFITGLSAVMAVISYFATCQLFKKKLNLA